MISENVICEVKKDKFYKAVNEIYYMDYFFIFYSIVIYFRYRSFIKCTKNQEEKDVAYLALYKVKGNMWGGIILAIFMLSIIISFIFGGVKSIK